MVQLVIHKTSSIDAIARLTKAGYKIVVATNQSGVGRGLFSLQILQDIHSKMNTAVENAGGKIDKVYFCPHLPDAGCDCRKPKPGMFEQIATDYNIDLHKTPAIFVGDSLRDVELGLHTGSNFFLVTSADSDGPETLLQLSDEEKQQITIVENLAEVVDRLLA
jgi:D-glycero-D-manno-heptose 1,7-bisphosphate phosphatase